MTPSGFSFRSVAPLSSHAETTSPFWRRCAPKGEAGRWRLGPGRAKLNACGMA
jgi:hypothetical protein